MQFLSGTDQEPALGFSTKPSIAFTTSTSSGVWSFIPTANTCASVLHLPCPPMTYHFLVRKTSLKYTIWHLAMRTLESIKETVRDQSWDKLHVQYILKALHYVYITYQYKTLFVTIVHIILVSGFRIFHYLKLYLPVPFRTIYRAPCSCIMDL